MQPAVARRDASGGMATWARATVARRRVERANFIVAVIV
jgi:tRNA U34 5-methylaminomethyl-2-thiouridine-forming methyltransferase MnmC